MKGISVTVSAGTYLAAAAGVLILPLKWLLCALFAAAVHELGHLITLFMCHAAVYEISIGAFGAKISTEPLLPGQEILCAGAGPLCSLGLILFADAVPVLALIGLVQGIFNLLPVYPMDGGRIVGAVFRLISEK